jgi:hypothetical protein
VGKIKKDAGDPRLRRAHLQEPHQLFGGTYKQQAEGARSTGRNSSKSLGARPVYYNVDEP